MSLKFLDLITLNTGVKNVYQSVDSVKKEHPAKAGCPSLS